jgi:hypothetical protein
VAGSDTGGQPVRTQLGPRAARSNGRPGGHRGDDGHRALELGQELTNRNRYDENAKIVDVVNVAPAFSSVDGKFAWLGEFGKCWVSNV